MHYFCPQNPLLIFMAQFILHSPWSACQVYKCTSRSHRICISCIFSSIYGRNVLKSGYGQLSVLIAQVLQNKDSEGVRVIVRLLLTFGAGDHLDWFGRMWIMLPAVPGSSYRRQTDTNSQQRKRQEQLLFLAPELFCCLYITIMIIPATRQMDKSSKLLLSNKFLNSNLSYYFRWCKWSCIYHQSFWPQTLVCFHSKRNHKYLQILTHFDISLW